ncbi:DUF4446 family protein [Nocardiopsis aegyptia]|uniref:DUF4446 family protein n=1 Tax=Nocardiopsis aegyptia TaxID=220378 RepID=UPI00366EEF80
MFTTILASIGMLAGLGGLICGGYALTRARAVTSDSQALADRAAAAGAAGTDPRAVRDVAVLHYDALEEMSGARSFSLAMLNSDGDGVVLTSINGRTESRTYAKAITRGDAESLLSPEEYRVIRSARLGDGVGSGIPVTVPRPTPSGDAAKDADAPDDLRVTVLDADEDAEDADASTEAEVADADSGDADETKAGTESDDSETDGGTKAGADADTKAGADGGGPGGRPRGERTGAGRGGRDAVSARTRRDRTRDGRPV